MIHLRTSEEMDTIARGGAIIAGLLEELPSRIAPGVTTGQIDAFCEQYIVSHDGAVPAFKGLYGFPGAVCVSVNEEVVHGVPSPKRVLSGFPGAVCVSVNEEVVHGIPSSKRVLSQGDIVSVDVGVKLDGWCSDSAWTFPVGQVSAETRRLLDVTSRALEAAVEAAVPGKHIGDIGAAVIKTVEGTPYGIIRELVGHGVGRDVHEEPQVPNVGRAGHGALLREGMVLAIEPMLAAGSPSIRTLRDGWTVVTADRSLTAHYEHTVGITAQGPRVLTGVAGPVEALGGA